MTFLFLQAIPLALEGKYNVEVAYEATVKGGFKSGRKEAQLRLVGSPFDFDADFSMPIDEDADTDSPLVETDPPKDDYGLSVSVDSN
jgi:hypothetical protein